jgi:hypothetical protein
MKLSPPTTRISDPIGSRSGRIVTECERNRQFGRTWGHPIAQFTGYTASVARRVGYRSRAGVDRAYRTIHWVHSLCGPASGLSIACGSGSGRSVPDCTACMCTCTCAGLGSRARGVCDRGYAEVLLLGATFGVQTTGARERRLIQ